MTIPRHCPFSSSTCRNRPLHRIRLVLPVKRLIASDGVWLRQRYTNACGCESTRSLRWHDGAWPTGSRRFRISYCNVIDTILLGSVEIKCFHEW